MLARLSLIEEGILNIGGLKPSLFHEHTTSYSAQFKYIKATPENTFITTSTMVRALIVGATRGLGASLAKRYASQASNQVFTTARSTVPKDFPESVKWLSKIDLLKSNVGDEVASQLKGEKPLDVVVSN